LTKFDVGGFDIGEAFSFACPGDSAP